MEDFDLLSIGIPKDRIELFQGEIEDHKHDAQFFMSLGDGLLKKRKFEEAVNCYNRALAINPSIAEVWNNLGVIFISTDKLADAARNFEKAVQLDPELYTAFFNLGLLYLKANRLEEARKCQEKAIQIFPRHFGAHLSLGSIYGRKSENDKALFHYEQAASVNPEHEGARHMICALRGELSERAPVQYVEELFDSYSKNFEEHLITKLQYRIPEVLAEEVLSLIPRDQKFQKALDLGCGTGLVGRALGARFDHITGVDLSKNMLALAKEKNIYGQLVREDLCGFLSKREETYDLITAADVFIYSGELRETFDLVKARLAPGGIFAFSLESFEGKGYVLRDSGRFAHSAEYVKKSAEGLSLKRNIDGLNLRIDTGKFLKGAVFVFVK